MSKKKVVKKTTGKDLNKKLTGNDVQVVVEGNTKFGLEFYRVNPKSFSSLIQLLDMYLNS